MKQPGEYDAREIVMECRGRSEMPSTIQDWQVCELFTSGWDAAPKCVGCLGDGTRVVKWNVNGK